MNELSATRIRELLETALTLAQDDAELDPFATWRSFDDAGVLTSNEGLVLRIGDSEFQLTIVQSR